MKFLKSKKIIPILILLISAEFLLNGSKLAWGFTSIYHPWVIGILTLIMGIVMLIKE